jgi:DNA-binding NtrC family response regulator
MSSRRVLIIDPDSGSGESLKAIIADWKYDVLLEQELHAVSAPGDPLPAAIIASSSTGSGDNFQLLRDIRAQQPDIPLIWLTDAGSVEMALHVIQQEGAYHYFEKPVDADKLRIVLDRAVELSDAKRENTLLRRQLQERGAFGELVGASEQMRQI